MTGRTRGKTAEFVRDQVVQDIHSGFFRSADKLSTEALALRYSVSRTPVREALISLQRDRIVSGTANSGYELRRPSLPELCEMYEIREEIEGLAVSKLAGRGASPELIAELRECCELRRNATDFAAVTRQDKRFHQLICDNCGSQTLQEMISNYLIISIFFSGIPFFDLKKSDGKEDDEHEAIVNAIAAGDAKDARRLMAKHISHARKMVEKLLGTPDRNQ